MIILGLTGSIGMGKSFVAQCFREEGIPVFDADGEIHQLMERGGAAVEAVAAAFPEVVDGQGAVDRARLGALVFQDTEQLRRLEAILHPMVRERGRLFFAEAEASGQDIIVQDVPLLYETGADKDCHLVMVVSAPELLQAERVLGREGMDEARLEAIRQLQLQDEEKRNRADIVIDTAEDKDVTRQTVRTIIEEIRSHAGA